MHPRQMRYLRSASLLAINLLFLTIWGFAAVGKVLEGVPPYFRDKFAKTFLATFPGVGVSFWTLAILEGLTAGLAGLALVRGEFLERRGLLFLPTMLVGSLFVFLQLGFGQWLT